MEPLTDQEAVSHMLGLQKSRRRWRVVAMALLVLVCALVPFTLALTLRYLVDRREQEELWAVKAKAVDLAGPLKLSLAFEGPQSLNCVRVKVDVTNSDARVWHWDREFSVFLTWSITDDHGWKPQRRAVSKRYPKTKEVTGKDRFILLEPGATVSRTILLTESVREFVTEPDWNSGDVHPTRFFGYEQDFKYIVLKRSQRLDIALEYRPSWWRQESAFRDLFGYGVEKAELPPFEARSNDLVLLFGERAAGK
jgi:hypothetical protein